MVLCIEILVNRARIVTIEKGNFRSLVVNVFVMISCILDESKRLSNYFGKEFYKNIFRVFYFEVNLLIICLKIFVGFKFIF